MAFRIVAFLVIFSTLLISGCGFTQPQVTIKSSDVFNPSMIGQTWHFQNGYGEINTIDIMAAPPHAAGRDGNNAVWHYTKTTDRTYWALFVPKAELFFVLHQNTESGTPADEMESWRSTASLINFPEGCPWCGNESPYVWTFDVIDAQPGLGLPYQIIPPTISTGQRLKNESRAVAAGFHGLTLDPIIAQSQPLAGPKDGEFFRTDFYVADCDTPVYKGQCAISDQREGMCVHEKWYFAPGFGLVQVDPLNDGADLDTGKTNSACSAYGGKQTHDPKLTIKRIG